ncbi:DUF4411 family protein [Methanogenium sp. S4BF]|uniref:DUF4411 family protein n=1 Tax=Methanogenium sp. S4BF TaxID=1789226 RepID=UPI00241710CE|nr:DUF4411 family protein [Methanogenium sp. S4BF]WFN33466.1 DUF4411 family protein [Methanogenium sp. S4BF]
MKYLLDSNVFIEAKNGYYSFNIAGGFWDWLELFMEEQSFLTIREVRKELTDYNDELKDWIIQFQPSQFIEEDLEIQQNMREITNYVLNHETFSPENKSMFLAKADPWLIATAMARGYVVVTHENKVGKGAKKVKIPNICETFGVEYINVFELMRTKNVNLRL